MGSKVFRKLASAGCCLTLAAALMIASPGMAGEEPETSASVDPTSLIGSSAQKLSNGLWQIETSDGYHLTTHGPDAALDTHDDPFSPSTPGRSPVCATEYTQHILYAHLAVLPDRSDEVEEQIDAAVKRMNALLNKDAIASGGVSADYKVVCDSAGEIQIDSFAAMGTEFDQVVESARLAGFDDEKTNYTIFFEWDHPAFCGIASLWEDESAEASNANNQGGGYAITYQSCWNHRTPMHENGHNMGATQYSAPNSTGSGHHCSEYLDVMCYTPDGGDKRQLERNYECEEYRFDCGFDTYFDADPEPGEYLETNWNVGSQVNRFINFSGASEPPPPPANPESAPVANFTAYCLIDECKFRPNAWDPDNDFADLVWDFGDGSPVRYSYSPLHTYSSTGYFDVKMTAIDDAGHSTIRTKTVYVFTEDPDPDVPNLLTGSYGFGADGHTEEVGDWKFYKFQISSGNRLYTNLYTDCEGVIDCEAWVRPKPLTCDIAACPSHRLFIRAGARPTDDTFDCSESSFEWRAAYCYTTPSAGLVYVGIKGESENAKFRFYSSYYDEYYYGCSFQPGLTLGNLRTGSRSVGC